jgi:predicted carbohydrate-binding protein with CBM5 and CBM33 domain
MKTSFSASACSLAAVLLGILPSGNSHAHGTMEGSRMLQVRLAGPSGGTPAAWNGTYYSWNQNSRNFGDYDQPGFLYANYVADGTISSAGANDGVQSWMDFSGLNTPSANWQKTNVDAGADFEMTWLASATHEPSYFEVYLTKDGFDVATEVMGWDDLEYMGRWSLEDPLYPVTLGIAPNPVDAGNVVTYNWTMAIPDDRSGHVAAVVVWQREDPAGESFFATVDLNVRPVPEPSSALLVGAGLLIGLRRVRRQGGRMA